MESKQADHPARDFQNGLMAAKADRIGFTVIVLMALVPVIALFAPRAMAFLPGMIGLLAVMAWLFTGQRPALSPKLFLIPLLITAAAFASALWAIDPAIAIERGTKMALILLSGTLLIAVAQNLPRAVILRSGALLPSLFFAACLLASAEYLTGMPLYRFLSDTPATTSIKLHEFNRGSCVLAILLLPAFFCLKESLTAKKKAAAYGIALVSFSTIFIITASQSAQLAIICGLLVAFAFPYAKKWAWRTLKALLVILVMTAPWLAIWLFDNYAESIHALPRMGSGDQSASAGNRLEVWDYVSRYVLQNPLYGYGIEAARAVEEFDSAEIFQRGKTILHPHNFALQVWIEFGVFGALATCAFLVYVLNIIEEKFKYASQRILLPLFVVAVSIGATGYGMWQSWWLGLLLFAISYALVCARYCENRIEEKEARHGSA